MSEHNTRRDDLDYLADLTATVALAVMGGAVLGGGSLGFLISKKNFELEQIRQKAALDQALKKVEERTYLQKLAEGKMEVQAPDGKNYTLQCELDPNSTDSMTCGSGSAKISIPKAQFERAAHGSAAAVVQQHFAGTTLQNPVYK